MVDIIDTNMFNHVSTLFIMVVFTISVIQLAIITQKRALLKTMAIIKQKTKSCQRI